MGGGLHKRDTRESTGDAAVGDHVATSIGMIGRMTLDLSWVQPGSHGADPGESLKRGGSAMAEKSASLENEWVFAPDVPTTDFFQHRDIRSDSDLEWLVNDLVYALEREDFLRWEAVVCQELGLPLTDQTDNPNAQLVRQSWRVNENARVHRPARITRAASASEAGIGRMLR